MRDRSQHRIGDWVFDAESGALTGPTGETRLEDRTARTLALLCRRRGEIVSRQDILDEVWKGRSVSSNSVAIVVADLRRSLADDARAPTFIATIAKRGYRLNPPPVAPSRLDAPTAQTHSAWGIPALFCLAGGALAVGMLAFQGFSRAPEVLVVEPVANATGSADYQPLSQALGELVTTQMTASSGIEVVRSEPSADRSTKYVTLASHLILWNGLPTLSLIATDHRSQAVVWSAMAEGSKDRLPGVTLIKLDSLRKRLKQTPI